MKLRISNLLFLIFILISGTFAINLNEFEYHTQINIACSQYLGNVEFFAPKEFNKNMKIYFDGGNIFYKEGSKSLNYIKTNNWYSSRILGSDILSSEKILDNNYNTYLIIENKSKIQLKFNNPNLINLNKIILEIKDSKIDNLNLFDKNNNSIPFTLNKNLFTYDLNLNQNMNLNEITLELSFKDILKIREISFYEKKEIMQNSKFYFYLNNQCTKTFNLYFGKYGSGNLNYYSSINIPVSFNVDIKTQKNLNYLNDFDNDSILNDFDNCLKIKNKNQTDINYNKIGDACEDFDSDGILNSKDNCPKIYNPSQNDVDKDGMGNVCDTNADNRFFEKNNYLVYIIIGVVLLLFIGLSFLIMKK